MATHTKKHLDPFITGRKYDKELVQMHAYVNSDHHAGVRLQ